MNHLRLDATNALSAVSAAEALARLKACDPGAPGVVLALGPGAARRWRSAISAAGGAFASVASLDILVASAEEHALLPPVPEVEPALRIGVAGDVLRGRPELARSLEVIRNGLRPCCAASATSWPCTACTGSRGKPSRRSRGRPWSGAGSGYYTRFSPPTGRNSPGVVSTSSAASSASPPRLAAPRAGSFRSS